MRETPSDRILHSRLAPPRVPAGALRRAELVRRVLAGVEAGAVSVIAGAGYGKTTLLAQAAAASHMPVVWLSCDERLGSTSALLLHLSAGLRRIVPGFGATFSDGAPDDALHVRFANELSSVLSDDVVVVVDDVQALPGPAAAALRRAVAEAPPQVRLAFAGRREWLLRRADLGGRRHLAVGEDDLRLDAEEAAELLAGVGLPTDPSIVAALTERTEGWVSGLILAAQAGRSPERALAQPRSEVFALLAQEVFEAQSAPLQRFLLGSSVLDRFTPAIAAEVVGVDDAEPLVDELVARHLFCTPLVTGEGETWYRYHQLLRDFLRLRLGVRAPARRDLHARAGEALARRGLVGDAIGHFLAGRCVGRALDVLEEHAERLARGPEASELLGWLDRIPAREWDSRPGILAARTARLLVEELDYDEATEQAMPSIERLIDLGEHERAAFLLAKVGQTRVMGGLGRRDALERTSALVARVDSTSRFVPMAQLALAGGYAWLCEFETAERWLGTATSHPAALGSGVCDAYAAIIRAHFLDRVRGDASSVPRRLAAAIAALERRPEDDELAFVAYASSYRSFALSYLGRHDEVLDEVRRLQRLAEERGQDVHSGYAAGWLRATAFADAERWDELDAELRRIDRTGETLGGSAMAYYLTAFRAQLAAARGNAHESGRLVAVAEVEMEQTIGGPDFTALCDLGHAARLAGRPEEARRLWGHAREVACAVGAAWGRARASMLWALAAGSGDGDGALAEALDITRSWGFEDLWVHKERRVVAELLARAAGDRIGPRDQVRHLVALCGGEVAERLGTEPEVPLRTAGGTAPPALSVRLMGAFSARRGDRVVPHAAFGRERARVLLAALCAHPEGLARDQLLEWLWPDLPPQRGVNALNTTLHALRRAVEPEAGARARGSRVVVRSGAYRLVLRDGDAIDLRDFLRAATKALAEPVRRRPAALAGAEALY